MIVLGTDVLASIRDHAAEAFPHECCGFLLGEASSNRRDVRAVRRTENAREGSDRTHRFLITAETYLRVEREARAGGLSVLGFYHSHPNAEARPSAYDREHAWPWYSYVIAAVRADGVGDVVSWVLREDRAAFEPEEIAALAAEETRPWL